VSGRVVRYSEAFKQKVVEEVSEGRFRSPNEASQAYGIKGNGTVARWLKEYGKGHLLRKVVRVERRDEPGEIKRLKDRVQRLEKALADAHMDKALAESFFEILCEHTGTDPEAFQKKQGGTASIAQGKRRKGSGE